MCITSPSAVQIYVFRQLRHQSSSGIFHSKYLLLERSKMPRSTITMLLLKVLFFLAHLGLDVKSDESVCDQVVDGLEPLLSNKVFTIMVETEVFGLVSKPEVRRRKTEAKNKFQKFSLAQYRWTVKERSHPIFYSCWSKTSGSQATATVNIRSFTLNRKQWIDSLPLNVEMTLLVQSVMQTVNHELQYKIIKWEFG